LSKLSYTVFVNLFCALVYSVMIFLWKHYSANLIRFSPRWPARSFFVMSSLWVLASTILFYSVRNSEYPFFVHFSSFLLISAIFLFFIWRELSQFWHVGLTGADSNIKSGLDYNHALRLCRNQLVFLGTGAAKLTHAPEFEKALLRCRQDHPIKFLLMKPDDSSLEHAAKRAGKPPDEFKRVVISSLRNQK